MNTELIISIIAIVVSVLSVIISISYSLISEKRQHRQNTLYYLTENNFLKEFPKYILKMFKDCSINNVRSALVSLNSNRDKLIYLKYYNPNRYEKIKDLFILLEEQVSEYGQNVEPKSALNIEKTTTKLFKKIYE